MKTGIVAGISLVFALLSYSAITLFGTQPPLVVGLLFFIISVTLFTLIVLNFLQFFRKDLGFVIFEVLVICVSLSFLLGTAKLYQIETEQHVLEINNSMNELVYIDSVNDYYSTYIEYLNEEVSKYNLLNAELQSNIDKASVTIVPPAQVTNPPVAEVIYVQNEDYYEQEEEYEPEHEDEYEDDD